MLMLGAAQGLKSALEVERAPRGRNRSLTQAMRAHDPLCQLHRDSDGANVARRIGHGWTAECPACKNSGWAVLAAAAAHNRNDAERRAALRRGLPAGLATREMEEHIHRSVEGLSAGLR
jgi:hypothetical protein